MYFQPAQCRLLKLCIRSKLPLERELVVAALQPQ